MDSLKLLAENLPVAVAMIVMTHLFLKYMKTKDDGTDEVRKEATDAINRNTVALTELKTLIEDMDRMCKWRDEQSQD